MVYLQACLFVVVFQVVAVLYYHHKCTFIQNFKSNKYVRTFEPNTYIIIALRKIKDHVVAENLKMIYSLTLYGTLIAYFVLQFAVLTWKKEKDITKLKYQILHINYCHVSYV